MSDLIIPARDWVGSVPAGMTRLHNRGSADHPRWGMPHILDAPEPLRDGEAIDLSPPSLDADGNPVRMDALPMVLERLRALFGGQKGLSVAVLDQKRAGRGGPRERVVALFAYRGRNGERAWEVADD